MGSVYDSTLKSMKRENSKFISDLTEGFNTLNNKTSVYASDVQGILNILYRIKEVLDKAGEEISPIHIPE